MVHENIDCTVHISRIYDEKKITFTTGKRESLLSQKLLTIFIH